MKKWIIILLGVFFIGIQVISLLLIFRINNKVNVPNTTETEENIITIHSCESPVMDLQQAAMYVGVSSEQLEGMVALELKKLSESGSFTGEMIPYFKVDNKLLFYKEQLDIWLEYVTIQNVEYNLKEGYMW